MAAGRLTAPLSAAQTATAISPVPEAFRRYGLAVQPRSQWGADLVPGAAMDVERDVRVLLVHHTASPNTVPMGGTATVLREIYAYQTGPAKGWPDVCYEFFVDPDGLEGEVLVANPDADPDAFNPPGTRATRITSPA